jgi:hypothetical protein
MHHDLGWWGVVLSIVALVLMIPASMVANLLTPLFVNWLVSWSRSSLESRIAKLEKQLAELEQHPAIDEVQDQILWGITNLKMRMMEVTSTVAIIGYFGARTIANPDADAFKLFSVWVFIILNLTTFLTLRLRYQKDFRFKRSPKVREGLLKSINELKAIRASSPT